MNVFIWQCIYVAILIPTIFGNSLVLICIKKYKKFGNIMYLLIGNLAVSDLLVGAVMIPYFLLIDGGILGNGEGILPANKYTCLAKSALFVICIGSSSLNLLHISMERFLSLQYPLEARQHMTKKKVTYFLIASWLLVIFCGTLPLYALNIYDNNNPSCVSDEILAFSYKTTMNIAIIVVIFVNFMAYFLTMRIAFRKSRSKFGRNVNRVNNDAYHMVTIVIVFGLFVVCWLPYICVALILTVNDSLQIQIIRRWVLFPGLLNSTFNWVIFGLRNKDFRLGFKSILTCRRIEVVQRSLAIQAISTENTKGTYLETTVTG